MISLSAPMNSRLQCAAQKILLFIANEPISQATNLFRQFKALFLSALNTVSPSHSDCARRENKSVFRKSIASRPDPSLVSLYLC